MTGLLRVVGAFAIAAGAALAAEGDRDAGGMPEVVAQAGEWTPPASAIAPDEGAPPPSGHEDERPPAPRAQARPSPRKRPVEAPSQPQASAPQPPTQPPPQTQAPQQTQAPPRPQAATNPSPPPQAPSPQPQCPPPQPGAATTPAPAGTISGSSICGATIIGGTISGATIIGGTISGGAISGGSITQSNISSAQDAGAQAPSGKPADAQAAAPQTAPPGAAPPGQAQPPPAPAKPPQARSAPHDARSGPSPRSRPGQKRDPAAADDDDEDDEADLAARALERALVQRGALLLPVWGFEIAPAFTYGHTSQDTFAAIAGDSQSAPNTVGVRKRAHQMTGSLTARLGLPLDLQLEAAIPATLALSNVTIAGAASSDSSGFGVGDPRISLTWQMIRAGDVAPDIFLAANWKPRLGSSPFDAGAGQVGLGMGYDSVGGTVTAVKSADPLVLLANASYTANLAAGTKQGRRDPGNAFGLGGGAILAVSPDTSLSFLLDFRYKPDDTLDGKAVLGSDETVAVLQLGLGRVLSRSVLLNVTAAIGLTPDSPNFQLGLSMPVRF